MIRNNTIDDSKGLDSEMRRTGHTSVLLVLVMYSQKEAQETCGSIDRRSMFLTVVRLSDIGQY